MTKLIALLVLAAGSLMGQFELQCLSDAEICIDVAVTWTSKKAATDKDQYYPFVHNGSQLLGAPVGSHQNSHWSVDSEYILGSDILIKQLRYTKYKTTDTTRSAEISLQGEQYPPATGSAHCGGADAYLSGSCGAIETVDTVPVSKSLYITTTSGDPGFIELKVSDRAIQPADCSTCKRRIEWFIQGSSKAEEFFDKLFVQGFSRYSIQIARSGQTPTYQAPSGQAPTSPD